MTLTISFGRTIRQVFVHTLAIGLSQIVFVEATSTQEIDARLAETTRHSAEALQALQSKDMAAALKSLGEAADLSPGIRSSENDGLAAAAGGLHRALVQLSPDEQYELLYAWSMPSDSRETVRILTSVTPHDAPPKEFARVLVERPRETSFPISEIGDVRGLFSTGWTLVQAADEIGRLRRLTTELEQLAEKKTPSADVLLLLARLADRRGDPAPLAEGLQQRAAALRARPAEGANVSSSVDPSDIVLAAAALRHESLRPISEEILKLLAEIAKPGATRLRPYLRIAHATAAQLHHGVSGPETLYENHLKYWIPVSGDSAETSSAGAPAAMWLVHEDHILHLAGAGNDVLFFRYPLSGEFDFACETQVGGDIGTEGGLVYGGLHFEALGSPELLTAWDGDLAHQVRRPCPFVRQESHPTFNRVSIRSTDNGAVFAANLHPMWFDGPSSKTSPWLGLRSFGERRPLFRNLKITGAPVIPREVRLAEGDQLRGWLAGYFGETQPPFGAPAPSPQENAPAPQNAAPATPIAYDWSVQDGVIRAARREAPEGATLQSLLKYHRPLLEGESVSYEFRYQPGQEEVHPTLGRLAFLIEPEGVRIHWITAGNLDWSGLPPGNATLEPLNRRGPRPLPLKENDWNEIVLARAKGKATVSLNGDMIYERAIDFGGDLTFGLYRNAARSAAEVRNIVLTGDWPQSLPEEFLQNPATVVASQAPSDADRHVLHGAAGEEFISENIREVRRRASNLPMAERYEFLARWILPGADHPGIRMTGEFTPTDPSPLAVKLAPEQFPSPRGGELVSPVFDLLDGAAELGKLDELRNRISAVPDSADEEQQRAKATLLLLVNLEIGDFDAATSACEVLQQLVLHANPETAADMWPETLAVQRALVHVQRVAAVGDLLNSLYARRTQISFPDGCEHWHARITHLMERYRRLAAGVAEENPEGSAQFDHWVSAPRLSARSRGDGFLPPIWIRSANGEAIHVSGHHEDYLFFRSPLRGAFEIVGDMGAEATTQLFAAGKFFGPRWRPEEFETGLFRQGHWIETVAPFAHFDAWIRFRAVFRDGVRTIYINGRPMHTETLPEHSEPWSGARAWSRAVARLQNVQIVGDAQIPDSVVMSGTPQLLGWVPYFDELVEGEWAIWRHAMDTEIHGLRRENIEGAYCESLLSYYRPLAEDGAVEYDFYYVPGAVCVHPALDRMALLLAPGGVKLHWITDGRFDRSDVLPDNAIDEPQNRRGPAQLPLKSGQWNRAKLAVTGNTATLHLNGQLVYERPLEATNRRNFGLFYYPDQTTAHVRNVVMHGGWPKTLPTAAAMELGDSIAESLDADLPRLKAVFTHDFSQGLPEAYFQVVNSDDRGGFTVRKDGVLAVRAGADNWPSANLKLPFKAIGDFDVEVAFQVVKFESDKDAVAMLLVNLDDPQQHQCRLMRTRHAMNYQRIEQSLSVMHPTGERSYSSLPRACESSAGTLRIARRGATVYYLFAEEGSRAFQCVGTHVLSDAPMTQQGIDLHALCRGVGVTQVVWKNISLRAEQIKYLPPSAQPERGLYVMDADGGSLRRLTGPAPGFTHLGSPEWSADGERIALDMSQGSVATSHIILVNADGGELEDIGPGCMPSLSPVGKRIAFSHSGEGVMMMNSDGSNRETIDSAGWGVQWSPDGKYLAYGKSGNIVLMDLKTRQQRLLLSGEDASRYGYIYWNLGWSHDSRWIAFKAQNQETRDYELAAAAIDVANSFQVLYKTTGSLHADFTWSPDNRRVLFAMHTPQHQASKLFLVDRTAPAAPQLFPNHPEGPEILNAAWSPDGRKIACTGEAAPQPVDWPRDVNAR